MIATPAPVRMSEETRLGLISAMSAYVMWGFLPIYFKVVGFADPVEILGQRILWCLPAALALMPMMGGLSQLGTAFKGRTPWALALSSIFILGNWSIFIWAVAHDRVMETALAYFIAPLVNVAVGVGFFGERLSRLQIVALALATLGVVAQGFALGAPPLLSLAICASWSGYALVRKQTNVPSAAGMFVETLWLTPLALGLLIWVSRTQTGLAFDDSAANGVLLALGGPVTAAPLILFALGARRLSFGALGVLQYIAPTLGFFVSLAYGEPFTTLHALSFGLIWSGLAFFTWDAFDRDRRARQPSAA